jgi:Flp pilus assembly pilin Flp
MVAGARPGGRRRLLCNLPGLRNGDQKKGRRTLKVMDRINRSFIRVREWQKGQTMTEYVLIVSAMAEVVFVAYRSLGTELRVLLNAINSAL